MLLQFSFLLAAIIENHQNLYISIGLGIICVLLILFFRKNFQSEKSHLKMADIILILFTSLGAILTYWLNTEFDFGVIIAAATTGLLSSFIPFFNRKSDLLREVPVAMYCGAFAGMTSPLLAQGYFFIISAGTISGIILTISKSTLHGFGGKLGTIAFGGVAIVSLLFYLIS